MGTVWRRRSVALNHCAEQDGFYDEMRIASISALTAVGKQL
jgi:hypothetical protein